MVTSAALTCAVVVVDVLFVPAAVHASGLTPVALGDAAAFSVLSGASVGNTATGPITVVRGDLGVVAGAGAVTGFPPGIVTGTKHASGSQPTIDAMAALVAAYGDAAGRTQTAALAGDLIGLTLTPGVHHNVGAVANTGTVTLDGQGDPNAVFIFQLGGALSMAAGAQVVLTNGTRASNVFWQVNGAAALGAGVSFAGTIMAMDAIAVGANSVVNGRTLARTGAVSLNSDQFYSNPPAIVITGGAAAATTDDTPSISGTTNVEVPAVVTITIGTQTLSATVQSGGSWTATAAMMPNATYTVTASTTDRAGNAGTATQSLVVDTVLPVVFINGGATRLTNDTTPTIAGTTDVGAGATVTIAVAGQTLTTLVQAGGTWNTTPAALLDGVHTVTVSVMDPPGNPGTASQLLTIDTTPSIVTITGGTARLTNDSTPTITGTSVEVGSTVTVAVMGQSLVGTVLSGGVWSVTAATVADGVRSVVATVLDPAGNPGSALQSLTIDTVMPVIAITGGTAAATADSSPTITGTSDAAVGTTVTVIIAGRTLTALVQGDGTWNATPPPIAAGVYTVTASVADPAGNLATASQSLDVSLTVPAAPIVPPIVPPVVPPVAVPVLPPLGPAPAGIITGFNPVPPARLFDTRVDQSPHALRPVGKHKVAGLAELRIQVSNLAGSVPASGVGAVSLTVTATNADADGFITVYACGAREFVSSVNFTIGKTVANAVIAPVSADGSICVFASAPTDVIADINGWFATGDTFSPVGPKRAFDTRPDQSNDALRTVPKAPVQAGTSIEVRLTDLGGVVPAAGVGSVSLNVTVTDPEQAGFVTVDACGTRALVSSVNYVARQTVANAVVAPVSTSGTVCFWTSATTNLVVDINGWLQAGSAFTAVNPHRVFDTRVGQSPESLRDVAKQRVGGAYVLQVKVTGLTGVVPAVGVGGVSLNVTAVDPSTDGFVTVYPCTARDEVSNLNYVAGQTVANAVLTPVSADGTICLFSMSATDLVVDVNGWFSNRPSAM